jgi:hypothetical protein
MLMSQVSCSTPDVTGAVIESEMSMGAKVIAAGAFLTTTIGIPWLLRSGEFWLPKYADVRNGMGIHCYSDASFAVPIQSCILAVLVGALSKGHEKIQAGCAALALGAFMGAILNAVLPVK